MTHRSTLQPHCLNCGTPIRMETRTMHVLSREELERSRGMYREGRNAVVVDQEPQTVEDCRKLIGTKLRVTNVTKGRTGIVRFSVWDGQTWVESLFCKQKCAAAFGRAAVRAGWRPDGNAPADSRPGRRYDEEATSTGERP